MREEFLLLFFVFAFKDRMTRGGVGLKKLGEIVSLEERDVSLRLREEGCVNILRSQRTQCGEKVKCVKIEIMLWAALTSVDRRGGRLE